LHSARLPTLLRPYLWLRSAGAAALIGALAACGDSLRAVGPSPEVAERHADQLFDALSTRFLPFDLSPRFELARVRLGQSALVPSRIFNDTSVWEGWPNASTRVLYADGGATEGRYKIETTRSTTPATRPGDSRHTIVLEQLAPNIYRWDTLVDLAIGTASAEDISKLLVALLRAPEGRTEAQLRDDYRGAFPRASGAWGHGFSIDTLHVVPGALGTTTVALTIGFHPELMRTAYPAFAAYLDKYLGPAKYHFVLDDRADTPLFEVTGRSRAMTIHYRVQKGTLVSLFGAPRPWPASDTLQLTSDLSLKVKMFTVGFHDLVTDFVISNVGHERAWTIVARREPGWDLPLVTERLIRTPLHRPFEGAGSLFQLSVLDSAGQQTVFGRRTRLDVQESAIVRFLGALGAHALGDLDLKVEQEEHRFLRDGFIAAQGDLRALAPAWRVRRDDGAPPP
jgi:hypothetical protein